MLKLSAYCPDTRYEMVSIISRVVIFFISSHLIFFNFMHLKIYPDEPINHSVLLMHQDATATDHLFVMSCISARFFFFFFKQRLSLGIMVQLTQAFDGSTSCLHHSTKTEAHVRSVQSSLVHARHDWQQSWEDASSHSV